MLIFVNCAQAALELNIWVDYKGADRRGLKGLKPPP